MNNTNPTPRIINSFVYHYLQPIQYGINFMPKYNCSRYARTIANLLFKKQYIRGPGKDGGDAWVVDDYNKRIWIERSNKSYSNVVKLGMIVVMANPYSTFNHLIVDKYGKRRKGKGTHMGTIVHIDDRGIFIWNQYDIESRVDTLYYYEKKGFKVVQIIDAPPY